VAEPIWISSLIEDRPQNGAHLAWAVGPLKKNRKNRWPRVLDVCRKSITLRLTSGRVYSRTARSGSSERISRVSRRAPLNLHFICFISGCLLFFSTRSRTYTHATCKSPNGLRGGRLSREGSPTRANRPRRVYNPLRRMRRRCIHSHALDLNKIDACWHEDDDMVAKYRPLQPYGYHMKHGRLKFLCHVSQVSYQRFLCHVRLFLSTTLIKDKFLRLSCLMKSNKFFIRNN